MSTFTVTEILSSRPWPSDQETKVVYTDFKVDGESRVCNIGRKPGNELKVGESLTGTFDADERGKLKFKPDRPAFNGAGPRPRDPAERRSIQMQASQKVAVDIARLALERAEVPAGSEQITAVVKTVARALFDQIEEVAA